MVAKLVEARHVAAYTLWLRFSDGSLGEIDLAPELVGEVFEPLRDVDTFLSFQIHPELRTLVWPNGADFAPEFLHDSLRIVA